MAARPGTIARTRGALRSADFRKLLAIRLVGQVGDGFFQAALVASVVFSPDEGSTTVGLFKAGLIVALPFTVLGPFVGVFIDRWPRRRILAIAPVLKALLVGFALFDPVHRAVPFYVGTLALLSVNRFYLATAVAVTPRVVPTEDLLMANSLATVGGTLALLIGVFAGGRSPTGSTARCRSSSWRAPPGSRWRWWPRASAATSLRWSFAGARRSSGASCAASSPR